MRSERPAGNGGIRRRDPARVPSRRGAVFAAMLAAVVVLSAGCLTLTNHTQTCRASGAGGFTCTGSAGTVKGEGSLTFDGGDDTDPDYRMDLTASVESGTMDVFATTVDGDREGGEVSPGNPIRIRAVVPSSDENTSVTLSVKGGEDAEVRGLDYEAGFARAD